MPPKPPVPQRAPAVRPYFLIIPLLSLVASQFPGQWQSAVELAKSSLLSPLLSPFSSSPATRAVESYPPGCPDYTTYSQTAHEPKSVGELGLPNMRPEERCR